MASRLAGVPIASRRRVAVTTGAFAVLFAAIAIVTALGDGPAGSTAFCVVAVVVALVLALVSWGVARSISIDRASQRIDAALDDAIQATLAEHPQSCGCGHEHDPDELHITDAPGHDAPQHDAQCAHDGTGHECAHDCQTCVLATLRQGQPDASRP